MTIVINMITRISEVKIVKIVVNYPPNPADQNQVRFANGLISPKIVVGEPGRPKAHLVLRVLARCARG